MNAFDRFLLRLSPAAVAAAVLTLAPVAFGPLSGCSDDGDGGMDPMMPDAGPVTAWVCGPINCGLEEACVFTPATRRVDIDGASVTVAVPESYRCVPDIGCGSDVIIECAQEQQACIDAGRDRRECGDESRECIEESQRMFVRHYGCVGQFGQCREVVPYSLIESPVTDGAGIPVDPRAPDTATPGIYAAPFVACNGANFTAQ